MNTFANTPRYIATPDCQDIDTWYVIDMHLKKLIGDSWSKEDAQAEVRKLNSKGLN